MADHHIKIYSGWDIIELQPVVKVIWLVRILAKSTMCQLYLLSRPIRIFNIFIAKTGGPVYCLFKVICSVWGLNLLGRGVLLRHWPDAYCFLLLAGLPLAPWRLALLFVYNTPFYLLLFFIVQCSYLVYFIAALW